MTGNSRIPTTEVIITSIFIKTRPKASFFPWFKVNNLKLELRMTLKFYTAVTKRDKTNSQKVFALNFCVSRSPRGENGWRTFLSLPS